jgi:hypothetical protein
VRSLPAPSNAGLSPDAACARFGHTPYHLALSIVGDEFVPLVVRFDAVLAAYGSHCSRGQVRPISMYLSFVATMPAARGRLAGIVVSGDQRFANRSNVTFARANLPPGNKPWCRFAGENVPFSMSGSVPDVARMRSFAD